MEIKSFQAARFKKRIEELPKEVEVFQKKIYYLDKESKISEIYKLKDSINEVIDIANYDEDLSAVEELFRALSGLDAMEDYIRQLD